MNLAVLFFYGFAFLGIAYSTFMARAAIRNKEWDTCIMLFFLFIQSLIIVEYVFYWSGLYIKYPYLINIHLPLLLLFGPSLYVYIDFAFQENSKMGKYYWHFLPAILVFVFLIPYYFFSFGIELFSFREFNYLKKIGDIPYLIMISMTLYCLIFLHKGFLQKRIGYTNHWLMLIIVLFGIYTICYIFYHFASQQPWYTFTTDHFVSLCSCASIVAIVYFSYGKKQIFNGYTIKESVRWDSQNLADGANEISTTEEQPIEEKQIIKYKNSGLTDNARNEVARALSDLMQREKLYRENELKLETLARKLGVERHYVSQVINQHFGVNFFEYINLLRIEEAKSLLVSTDLASSNIIEIAYQVGYNTKNTFNAAFRRIVGVTPTEFRKKQTSQSHLL